GGWHRITCLLHQRLEQRLRCLVVHWKCKENNADNDEHPSESQRKIPEISISKCETPAEEGESTGEVQQDSDKAASNTQKESQNAGSLRQVAPPILNAFY